MKKLQFKISLNLKSPQSFINSSRKVLFNFVNLNTLWWVKNNPIYSRTISDKCNLFFPDSKVLSLLKGLKQQRGPSFTKDFLMSNEARTKRHFFIGLEDLDLANLSKITNISKKRLLAYNPPYIKGIEFSSDEINRIYSKIIKFKPDLIWVCVGSPKQEILSNQLFKKYKSTYINIGAATDFLLKKKKEAPKIFQMMGLEWFYRLITDFKYSKTKVWRSFIALNSLDLVKAK